mgnify:FL=1
MTLYTERTTIIPLIESDIPEILEMYLEPDSFKFISPHKDKSKEYYQSFLQGKLAANKKALGFWSVRLNATNEFVGTVNLNQFQDSEITHIGCHLKSAAWNKGFATELMKELIKYGFEVRNLKAIHGIVEEYNIISAKLMKRLGFDFIEEIIDKKVKLNIYRCIR